MMHHTLLLCTPDTTHSTFYQSFSQKFYQISLQVFIELLVTEPKLLLYTPSTHKEYQTLSNFH
jgi:hypothetical protein